MKNILVGGKLGDFIHALILPKYIFDTTGEKSNVYICNHENEVFASGIHNSYNELLPIMLSQRYVNDFQIFAEQTSIDIDLTKFRQQENLFSTSWNEFYLWNYINDTIHVPFNYSWIETPVNDMFKDSLLINRNILPYVNETAERFYENYVRAYKDRVFFICSWPEQYENFSLKNEVPMILMPKLHDVVNAIGSCKHFLGNLTATAAIASATNTNRTIEIFSDLIRTKYIHELKNYDNLICFE